MNIAGIDLNLLLVFDAVMAERNATKAGQKIGMSQPAVSNALNRLRHRLKDDLFVRGQDGMRPTARAIELATPIRTALMEIEEALNPKVFDPATTERAFTIAANDYVGMTLMPYVATYISNEAPGVDIHTIPIMEAQVFHKLDTQQAEYGIFPITDIPERFNSIPLGGDEFVCLMRADHELAKYKDELPMEEYAAARHLLVSPRGDPHGFVDDKLAEFGLNRRVVMTVNNFGPAPMIVLSSDMIVTLPRRMAEKCCKFFDMHVVPSPVQSPNAGSGMILFWHNRLTNHPAHNWFQGIMQRAAKDLEIYGMDHYLNIDLPGQ